MEKLTHLDESGHARMVDITSKGNTNRVAVAKGIVRMKPSTLQLLLQGDITKGDVLGVARVAGIMGAKQTPSLIPLCHPLLLGDVNVDFKVLKSENSIEITATVSCTGQTGVEMEAMTTVAVSALTIYDMCKAVDRTIKLDNIRLLKKSGGKSGSIVLEEA
ncbi:MAG: cyclic pyranopterin monophosphate synthase MoaC [Dehalococcoidia bacterium]|nr:cyclic pyranopterin monophosphate synthase MoaC [Dehalococcoidia bacterium]